MKLDLSKLVARVTALIADAEKRTEWDGRDKRNFVAKIVEDEFNDLLGALIPGAPVFIRRYVAHIVVQLVFDLVRASAKKALKPAKPEPKVVAS